jgi:hypothetical protein
MAHSASPWVVLDLRETEECLSVCCWDEGNIVCRIKNTVNQKPLNENDEANANLIAAAPDLLEACEKALFLLRKLRLFGSIYDTVDVAIKKATSL